MADETLFVFPSELKFKFPFIKMDFYEWNVQNRSQLIPEGKKGPAKYTYVLPAPEQSLQETFSQNWQETEGLWSTFGGIQSKLVGAVLDLAGKAIQDQAKSGLGYTVNDYSSLMYNGQDFRTFSFNWTFSPMDLKDAEKLFRIMKTMKESINADFAMSVSGAVNFPYFLQFVVYSMGNEEQTRTNKSAEKSLGILFKSTECVVTNFTCNYTPSSFMKQFSSGHPTSVQISMEIKELRKLTRTDFDSEDVGTTIIRTDDGGFRELGDGSNKKKVNPTV